MIQNYNSDFKMNFLDTLERVKIKVSNLCLETKDKADYPLIENDKMKTTGGLLSTRDSYIERTKKEEEDEKIFSICKNLNALIKNEKIICNSILNRSHEYQNIKKAISIDQDFKERRKIVCRR